jgi:hypothetical protein
MLRTSSLAAFDPQEDCCFSKTRSPFAPDNRLLTASTNTLSPESPGTISMDELYLFEAIPFNPSDYYEVEHTCTSASGGGMLQTGQLHDNLYIPWAPVSSLAYKSSRTNNIQLPTYSRKGFPREGRPVTRNKKASTRPYYAHLIYDALIERHDKTMSLSELYDWFILRTTKTENKAKRVWQRGIRQNLAKNAVCYAMWSTSVGSNIS